MKKIMILSIGLIFSYFVIFGLLWFFDKPAFSEEKCFEITVNLVIKGHTIVLTLDEIQQLKDILDEFKIDGEFNGLHITTTSKLASDPVTDSITGPPLANWSVIQ